MEYKFKTKPYEHQANALKKIFRSELGHALFMDPGTGKTKIAIDSVASFHQDKKVKKVLILCPINALSVWPKEFGIHSPITQSIFVRPDTGTSSEKAEVFNEWVQSTQEGDHFYHIDVAVFNYEALIRRNGNQPIFEALSKWKPDMIILDESQKVKTATAQRSKQAHKLCSEAEFTLLLTGTPIGKNLLDLYSQLKCISPSIWDGQTWSAFRNEYGIFGGKSGYELLGYRNADELGKKYQPYVSTARKEDCLDLPKVSDIKIPIAWDPTSWASYERFSQDGMVVHQRQLIFASIVLVKLLRMQQMTGHTVADENGNPVLFNERKLAYTKDLAENLMEAGQPVIIFARFKAEIQALQEALDTPYVIKGGVSAKRRGEISKDWKGEKPLIIQIASAEALDGLQHVCSHAIFFSTDFSWIHYFQARGRIDREGQKSPVTFYHMCMEESVDYLVIDTLREKQDLEKLIKDNPALLVVTRKNDDKINIRE